MAEVTNKFIKHVYITKAVLSVGPLRYARSWGSSNMHDVANNFLKQMLET